MSLFPKIGVPQWTDFEGKVTGIVRKHDPPTLYVACKIIFGRIKSASNARLGAGAFRHFGHFGQVT